MILGARLAKVPVQPAPDRARAMAGLPAAPPVPEGMAAAGGQSLIRESLTMCVHIYIYIYIYIYVYMYIYIYIFT